MAHQPLPCTGAEGPGPGAYLPGQLLLLHAEDVCEALHTHLQQLGGGVQAVPVLLQVLRVGWVISILPFQPEELPLEFLVMQASDDEFPQPLFI